jgi:hypothetical protein
VDFQRRAELAFHRHDERVHGQLARFPVRDHAEAILEQRLQSKHVLLRSRQHPFLIEVGIGRFRNDVEAIGVHPVGSADHLKGLEIEGVADEIACGLVRAVQPSAWAGTDRGARLARFIRANGCDLELRLGTVALDDLGEDGRHQQRKNE